MEKPLRGIRVMDFSQTVAGPLAARFLCDLGAEVIRIESTQHWQYQTRGFGAHPSKAFLSRQMQKGGYPQGEPGERPWDRWGPFHGMHRGKLSMTLDLDRPEGRTAFLKLAGISDIIISGNSPEMPRKLGVDYPSVAAVNPRIIYVSISGFGATGPYGGQRTLGPLIQTFMGHDLLRGYRDSDPTTVPFTTHPDPAAGVAAALGAVLALHHRKATGEGQHIEVAIGENFLPFLGAAIMDGILNGREGRTLGNRHASAIQGCYPCRGEDRWVVITIQDDGQWNGFCAALGHPEWTRDERFSDVISRHRNHDALDEHMARWTQEHGPHEVMDLLQSHGVVAGAVMDQADAYADPHLQARGFFQPLVHRLVGEYLVPGPAWRMSGVTLNLERPAPCLGEHNAYVYKELLGHSDEEYARLESEGHIGIEPAPNIP